VNFVSYAQNFEDVMLWRALQHVENGFYIDVGAQDAVVDSVSKAFYERGWRGVHVEPVPAYAAHLRADRPEDTVLQVALAEYDGTLTLNLIADTGLSTAVGKHAERHAAELGFEVHQVQVPVLTMRSAMAFLAGREVHWLKVDVEGFEEQVLKGWDSATLRPWVMVVEATMPNSREQDYAQWEPIVLAGGYEFVYFDGLNRFYVAKEHAELKAAFATPPNVFDGARLSGLASSELCRGVLAEHTRSIEELTVRFEAELAQGRAALAQQQAALAQEQAALAQTRANLDAAQASLAQTRADFDAAQTQADLVRLNSLEQLREAHQIQMAGVAADFTARLRAEGERASARSALVELARLAEERRLHAHIAWQEQLLAEARQKTEELNQSSHHWWLASQALQAQIDALYASASWRLAAPLRFGTRLVRWLVRLPKRSARFILRRALANPAVKRSTLGVLRHVPVLERLARRLAVRSGMVVSPVLAGSAVPVTMAVTPGGGGCELDQALAQELSPRATRILADIHQAIAAKAN